MQTLPNMYNVYELGYLQTLFEKNEHNIYIYMVSCCHGIFVKW